MYESYIQSKTAQFCAYLPYCCIICPNKPMIWLKVGPINVREAKNEDKIFLVCICMFWIHCIYDLWILFLGICFCLISSWLPMDPRTFESFGKRILHLGSTVFCEQRNSRWFKRWLQNSDVIFLLHGNEACHFLGNYFRKHCHSNNMLLCYRY